MLKLDTRASTRLEAFSDAAFAFALFVRVMFRDAASSSAGRRGNIRSERDYAVLDSEATKANDLRAL
jgi:hypothetical protein